MQVGISISGEIVVDSQVDTLNVDTTSENISGYADSLLEILERLVALDSIGPLASKHVEATQNTYLSS